MTIPRHHPGFSAADLIRAWRQAGPASGRHFQEALTGHFSGRPSALLPSFRWGLAWIIRREGWRPGEIVMVPEYGFPGISALLTTFGLRPIEAPVDPATRLIDFSATRPPPGTRAVILYHALGLPADLVEARAWADRHGVLLIEDCAHALGGDALTGRPGARGDYALYSFSLGKNLACGGGGALVSDRALPDPGEIPTVAWTVPGLLRNLAASLLFSRPAYDLLLAPAIRMIHRLSPARAARLFIESFAGGLPGGAGEEVAWSLGSLGLRRFADRQARRALIARTLRAALPADRLQATPAGRTHAWSGLMLAARPKESLARLLLAHGVDTRPDPNWLRAGERGSSTPGGILVPCHAALSDGEVERMTRVFARLFRRDGGEQAR